MSADIVSVGADTLVANISVDAWVAAAAYPATAHALAIAMKVLLVAEAVLVGEGGIATTGVACLDVGGLHHGRLLDDVGWVLGVHGTWMLSFNSLVKDYIEERR